MGNEWWRVRNLRQRTGDGSRIAGGDQFNIDESGPRADARIDQKFIVSGGTSLSDMHQYINEVVLPLQAEVGQLQTTKGTLLEALRSAETDFDNNQRDLQTWQVHCAALQSEIDQAVTKQAHARTLWITALLALVFGGLVSGLVVANTSPAAPEATTKTPAPLIRTETTTVTQTALPQPDPAVFVTMDCTPGTWVSFLSSSSGPMGEFLGSAAFNAERSRAREIAASLADNLHVSRWDEACPAARAYAGQGAANQTFVWVGPLKSQSAAEDVCVALKKTDEWDCLPRKAG